MARPWSLNVASFRSEAASRSGAEVAADLRGNLAALTAEREAARTNVELERAHGEQRVKDLDDTYGRRIDQLRQK